MLVKIPNKNLIIDNVKKIQKLGSVPLTEMEVGEFCLDDTFPEICQKYLIDYIEGTQETYYTNEVVFVLNNDGNTIDRM